MSLIAAAVAVSAATTLSACVSSSPTTVNGVTAITVGAFANALPTLPIQVAQNQGFFEQNKLEVDVETASSMPSLLQAAVARQIDVAAITGTVAATAIREGAPLKAIIGQGGGSTVVVSNSVHDTGATYPDSARALADRTIGVTAPGGYSDQIFKYIEKEADVPGMKYVTVTGVAENISALQSGRVQAVNLDPISAIRVQRMNLGRILYDFQHTGPTEMLNVPTTYGFANVSFAGNPAAPAFARAIAQAIDWIKNPANSGALQVELTNLLGQEVNYSPDELDLVRGSFVAHIDPAGLAANFAVAGVDADPQAVVGPDAPTTEAGAADLIGS
ncbi:ABC transporter substrate-binding protein [Nocardia sp. NPDC019395]|uniref:ABC transporter substrate-binding protein n=1 Tax=Nocardia sp. NPDC019395 TaxID=3154686 RepID=UPI0033D231A0